MAEVRVTLDQLEELLREQAAYRHARNLILVALPLATAHQQASELARRLNAKYIDFDCAVIALMEADDWSDHVALEGHGTLSIGQMLAERWLKETIRQQIASERPLVIGNINLAVRYDIDLAAALYDATENGVCVIAAGGRLQGQTLMIHGTHSQTGAGSPTYEVVRQMGEGPELDSQHSVQDRLL